jgi:hypothetical protein
MPFNALMEAPTETLDLEFHKAVVGEDSSVVMRLVRD